MILARIGYSMQLPSEFEQYTYYGRGPWNNYADRCSGSFIEQYQSKVGDLFVNFLSHKVWEIENLFAGVH